MLYQPTNISPSMLGPLGNGVVDANEDFIVSWQVNGNSPMTGYEIFIAEKTNPFLVFGTALDKPFYGTDYAGNAQMFRANHGTLTIENGKSYTMRIRQYWGEGEDDYVEQQSASSFITRDRPVVAITVPDYGEYLSGKNVTIKAAYSQAQGETLNWVRWRVGKMPDDWDHSSAPTEFLEDTGPIYGTAQLQYPFDGIFPGSGYCVQCTVQTQSGMEASSDWVGFYGEESGNTVDAQITACAGGSAGGIRLTLPEATSLIPKFSSKEPDSFQGKISLDYSSDCYVVTWGNFLRETIATSPFNFAWCESTNIYGGETNFYTRTGTIGRKKTYFSADTEMSCDGIYAIHGSGEWRTVVYKIGLYMALGDDGVAYSTDAKTWTMATIPESLSGNLPALSLCAGPYSDDAFFLASSATTTAAYTTDGVTWTSITMEKAVKNVFYADDRFYAAYTDGGLARTFNLARWDDEIFEGYSGTSPVSGIAYGNDIFVCIREDGTCSRLNYRISDSWDTTGKLLDDAPGTTYYGLCFFDGHFFARDNEGRTYISEDGGHWTLNSSSTFYQNASGSNTVTNGTLIVIGSENQLILGAYMRRWTICAENTDGDWKGGCFDGKRFVFVGSGGKAAIFRICIPFHLVDGNAQICSGTIYANNNFSILIDGTKLYAAPDEADWLEFPADLQWTDSTELSEINISGNQTFYWVLVSNGNLSEDDSGNLLGGMPYTELNFPTYLYTNFWNSANGGQYGTTGYNKFAIYRQDGDNESFQHVGDISVEDGNVLIDASAEGGKTYTYYAYGVGENYSDPVVTEPVHACGWDWHILACTQDDAGAYHVQKLYRFSNNLSSGSVSNNAGPSVLQNFTRYPTVQNSPWNYRSGTLTSLIGYTADGKYYDTKELRDEITALTTSDYALFLKNRKGDVIRIAVSGAIEMETMDNSASQAQTMKLPWTEIGDASDAQIVITKNDGAYLQSIPSPVVGGYCDCGGGASRSFAYPLTVLQSSGTTVYDGSESKKIVIKGDGGSGEVVAEDDGNGNITIY